LFNNLGISTQVPAKQTIKAKKAISVLTTTQKTKFLKVKIDKNIVPHRKSDRHLVEILEALLEIKKISGASSDDVVKKIASLIYSKSKNDAIKLSYLSLAYRPSVRAVLGAIFSLSGSEELLPLAKFIKKSLNPMTKYKLNITNNSLSNHREWNIQ
jgi:desulfoferrodoxin (superoxide reductase-like protein)